MALVLHGSAKWRQLVVSLKTACAAQYVPEYSDHNDRSMNYRYYR